jgi:hypothetical protein
VQFGFPNVGAIFIDQRDLRTLISAVSFPQSGRKFQPPCAATHDDDFVLCAHFHDFDKVSKSSSGGRAALIQTPRDMLRKEFV